MTKLFTRWLDESEMRQVAAMVEQGAAAIEKVLRRSRSQLFRAGGRRRG
jgi:hypothetical protein